MMKVGKDKKIERKKGIRMIPTKESELLDHFSEMIQPGRAASYTVQVFFRFCFSIFANRIILEYYIGAVAV